MAGFHPSRQEAGKHQDSPVPDTHRLFSHSGFESTLNRWTDFWWKPERLTGTRNGKNEHTHLETEPAARWRRLATPAHAFVSQQGAQGSLTPHIC